ncbi:Angiotensin-converting enzyme, putative [Pediculus humanus corporis]|uniref:Angiotensin-converting enzyme n=1 Tax=Pediculus humanus subsp. corporis TaxID=121224 RepID=E0VYZ7_PEDHC|nr:Angiotensin-converting enzyme, putative [Pediculus humanus corporis]EEB18603.1 Angiotensin-converting enzyme, putative [Pediculus humanus corporis]
MSVLTSGRGYDSQPPVYLYGQQGTTATTTTTTTNSYQTNTRYDPSQNQYYDDNFKNVSYNVDPSPFGQNNQNVFIPIHELMLLLSNLDNVGSEQCSANVYAQWEYETNVNDITQINALSAQQNHAAFDREISEILKQIQYNKFYNSKLWRELRYLSVVGAAALPIDDYERYNRMISEMVAVYGRASICAYNEPFRCNLRLSPDLTVIMARSRDWDELQHTWVEFRRRTGQYIKDMYDQLVDLTNEAAKLNNFTDAEEMWNFPYDSPNFEQEIEEVWSQIRPLYEQLHAYVRRKLRDLYGPEKISNRAPLPSHILGNMWAQSWTNILDVTLPYPGKTLLDVTPNMQIQGYTPLTMLQLAEEFFISMNLSAMPPEFWAGSIITEIPERVINCQASAWDFCNRQDYRLKMCAKVNMKDFVSMHHEMGHIQYFLQYKNQPKVFRDGANPGFHEAIGEMIALSVGGPTHLQKLGLIQTSIDDVPLDINYLFSLAMDKLPFLPFAYVMDKWRWDVFKRVVSKEQFNCHWHSLRERYLGVKPPLLRSEFDFDPGSKYHIPANVPYIRYFFSTVLQFQLHRHLCRISGQYDPNDSTKSLHKCDIYRKIQAGNVLKELMKYGSSLSWKEVLYRSIGENKLDGSALRDFFRPLEEWLRNENLRRNEYPGWIYGK